ncbi:MAG: [FeFe] hydrogenase H-cluster radical SAM maturase HydG [Omnitrophica bacterium RIFCSPLOWO2_12_FULL_44_17]|uniref:[FeFe] hydrogenase H-cluster radical SAM maturase HydG n=1 Tax=Candidatus Danuiimicrobium aquiferis TaxID=1801832 RepID=A0A1G1L2X7_9BACT|nr:MAG: [FeFe] hydrogenase H-cluster radical SAM maturase HydG [Omnitrophica bacterium RIFCSPHIGHO2_02_FULL_45_28]OGW91818.1 MAG: [FeFe] hydrogenase H-cluster radical SAM maturase HydG [Omnitrophica bacterium RIFCSPHIGHO2_12_FULL_44_12]OGW99530.1 MAG: [FeFe] hydrogenase H-cluster radical SAM maturase HydG [Omnitrophica bacterium RIFCSPLOWO2_12_FULL_44_17]OGX02701.1 MAG: [FeFe] hydrogenase H-cluster radical SAM maturase HydG [Omnitrophica bacterium RIFCSPLOWO2_02_FULL_44_11]
MTTQLHDVENWVKDRIKQDEITKYLVDGKDFIPDTEIEGKLVANRSPEKARVRDALAKSLAIETLTPDETAMLLHVEDPVLLAEMKDTALRVKKKVYDNRIVTFAPLYMGNYCVNNCLYCGFRKDNHEAKRNVLTMEEIRKEIEVLAGKIGHKRLIAVYGEHPETGIDYIVESLKTIYDVKVNTKYGIGNIRRVNVNAAPLSIEELKLLRVSGIGTYQVFQETYHHDTYGRIHPKGTIKANYQWRLYCMHRALEAGIDDVGIGALFGLYDWKFEVMGLVYHAWELETKLGIGPHTVSFPRLEPAFNSPLSVESPYRISDEILKRIILVIRLAIPYTGMIITARENAEMRREAISFGVTQTDASTKIGIGSYSDENPDQAENKQQFMLGDTRSLDEVIREFSEKHSITSFCTAGYRCGRTGECIMELLRSGKEGKFCKLNAVLTFQEWLDDFASDETKLRAQSVLQKEIEEIREQMPAIFPQFMECYERIKKGERDLYF